MNLIKIGAFTPVWPTQYGVELSDMDGENSNRSEAGFMNRDRVRAGIFKLKLGWTNLKTGEVDALLNAVSPESVTVTFYFGENVVAEMYAGNRTIDLKSVNDDGNCYWDVSFNMTEM